ncbi:MAG: UDP-glucose 4-epimerase GalE [Spirochaetaceae bacterium]|nr:MAG: UDP-glucose 4-epimerase GalE [Spirochaetaceae bacterium]
MKTLVIGGAGYIGSHVVKALRGAQHQVTVLDNLSSGLRENLQPGTEFVHGDLMLPGSLETAMRGKDAVIHLAAFKAAGESMLVPEKYALNNISGTINILNAMSASGVSRLVFSSSAAVYGEPEYLPVDENHPTRPENFYGFTKLEIERIMDWYDRLKQIRCASLRYFNAAGYDPEGEIRGLEQNPANLLPVVMEVAAGLRPSLRIFGNDYDTPDGTGVRDYIHVTDLADAHLRALDRIARDDTSLTVNLGSETGLSVLEILESSRSITGREIPAEIVARRPGDPAKLVASAARARDLLGWSPRHSDLETLVGTSWEAYRRR